MSREPRQHLKSMHAGHGQVQQNQGWIGKLGSVGKPSLAFEIIKQLAAGSHAPDPKVRADKGYDPLSQSQRVHIVINDQDCTPLLVRGNLDVIHCFSFEFHAYSPRFPAQSSRKSACAVVFSLNIQDAARGSIGLNPECFIHHSIIRRAFQTASTLFAWQSPRGRVIVNPSFQQWIRYE
jgi:hypothetical protein